MWDETIHLTHWCVPSVGALPKLHKRLQRDQLVRTRKEKIRMHCESKMKGKITNTRRYTYSRVSDDSTSKQQDLEYGRVWELRYSWTHRSSSSSTLCHIQWSCRSIPYSTAFHARYGNALQDRNDLSCPLQVLLSADTSLANRLLP